jgi:hypothetical protein
VTTIRLETVINRADFDRLAEAVQPRVILKVAGQKFVEFVGESFKTRGRGGWRPLAASTLAMRTRGGDVPLQDSGRYRQSFVGQITYERSGGKVTEWPVNPAAETDNQTYVEVGTSLKTPTGAPLGKIHEWGTRPYIIRVRRARTLAAKTRAGTWMIFGREVHHPGVPPRPVLPTVAQAEALLKPALEGMLEIARDGSS